MGYKTELINGKYYTKKEAAELLEIPYSTYKRKIGNLTAQEIHDNGSKIKTELINGKYYTKKEAAELSKIKYSTYRDKTQKGLTGQEIYDNGLLIGGKTELINGKYYTKKEAAELSGIKYGTYKSKIQIGSTAQKIYDNGSRIKGGKTELINGKYYTKKEAAELSGITYTAYLSKNSLNAQEIYDKRKNGKFNILINGKIEKGLSVRKIAEKFRFSHTLLGKNFKKVNDINLAIDISLLSKNKYRDSKGFTHDFKSNYEKELFVNGEFDIDKGF